MFGSIFVMALVPWLDTSATRSGRYRPMFQKCFWLLGVAFLVLMWCGAQNPDYIIAGMSEGGGMMVMEEAGPGITPFVTVTNLALIATIYWFAYFLIILPVLGRLETPRPVPVSIEADFDAHYPVGKSGGKGSAKAGVKSVAVSGQPVAKKRGRPAGSKNKPKSASKKAAKKPNTKG